METINQIKQILNEKIAQDNEAICLYDKVFQVIQKHEGQKITKRIENAVAKVLGSDLSVRYSVEHGMFYLYFYKQGKHTYDYSFLLGYDSDPFIRTGIEAARASNIDDRGFVSFNICYGSAAKERNKKREAILQNEQLLKNMANAIDKRNEAAKELESFCDYDIPGWYTIEKIGKKS